MAKSWVDILASAPKAFALFNEYEGGKILSNQGDAIAQTPILAHLYLFFESHEIDPHVWGGFESDDVTRNFHYEIDVHNVPVDVGEHFRTHQEAEAECFAHCFDLLEARLNVS